ncbi:hypothetical protein C8R46DRAFT_1344345 [Mycena filopes]|nr:hypothetical protein C8R46DRAFT_1344345 [Mycena filopes]
MTRALRPVDARRCTACPRAHRRPLPTALPRSSTAGMRSLSSLGIDKSLHNGAMLELPRQLFSFPRHLARRKRIFGRVPKHPVSQPGYLLSCFYSASTPLTLENLSSSDVSRDLVDLVA